MRAGSRFSGDAYIPARTVRWHTRPHHECQGRRGSHSTAAQTRHPRPPQQPSLCCLRGPAQQFHFPGGRRETREKENAEASGPKVASKALSASPGSVQQHCPNPGFSPPSALPSEGRGWGGHSDFHGSRPSQQHFGLRRDTERTRLIEARRTKEEGGRGKQKENRREDRRKRIEKEIKGGIKPPESLLVFFCPFFLPSYSFFLFVLFFF